MKLSVETFVLRQMYSDETAVRMIRAAGFDAYDYSFYWVDDRTDMLGEDYREQAQKLRSFSGSLGIACNQAHAPFEIEYGDAFSMDNRNYCRLVRSIEFAAILGAKNIIVHAIKDDLPETVDFNEYNLRFYESLIPWCKKFHICVCVENLFNWEGKAIPKLCDPQAHQTFVRELDSPWIRVCVDVGHSAITGYAPEDVLQAMDPELLTALHIHDNDGVTDQHILPGEGSIHWDQITRALREIGYKGDFTFELTGYLRAKKPEQMADALEHAHQVGRILIGKIEQGNVRDGNEDRFCQSGYHTACWH